MFKKNHPKNICQSRWKYPPVNKGLRINSVFTLIRTLCTEIFVKIVYHLLKTVDLDQLSH